MQTEFHSKLQTYLKNKDLANAENLIFQELANSLLKDRENFIDVLRESGISVLDGATDLQLVDAFVKNAPENKKLLLGASLLINHRNQVANFDGESELSDSGVKTTYGALEDFFNAGGAWAGALQSLADVGGKVYGGIRQQKYGASDALAQQKQARQQLVQNIMAQKQAEREAEAQKGKRTTKMLIIAGASLVGIALIIGVVMMVKKKK